MAPLRSSRSTRNQDYNAAPRRGGVMEFDAMEGLPVTKWEMQKVKINQDPSAEPTQSANNSSVNMSTTSAEWAAQFNNPKWPWPEPALPSFFNQLAPLNQELLRRARCPNTNPDISVYDPETNRFVPKKDSKKKVNPMKSVHLNNLDPSAFADRELVNGHNSPAVHDIEDDDDDDHDDDNNEADLHDDDMDDVETAPNVKRRKHYAPEERTFTTMRWAPAPPATADRTTVSERTFLAERRPGMPSLYGGAYQNQVFAQVGVNGYGAYGNSNGSGAGYDLGDGNGLSNATGVLSHNVGQPGAAEAATPVRRNVPPKRKKKKGGPGRRKANPDGAVPTGQATTGMVANNNPITGVVDGPSNGAIMQGVEQTALDTNDQKEGSESENDSEGEGSEEGEIEEKLVVDQQSTEQPAQEPVTSGLADESMSAVAPVSEATAESVTAPASEPVAERIADVVPEQITEPVTELVVEPVQAPELEPQASAATETAPATEASAPLDQPLENTVQISDNAAIEIPAPEEVVPVTEQTIQEALAQPIADSEVLTSSITPILPGPEQVVSLDPGTDLTIVSEPDQAIGAASAMESQTMPQPEVALEPALEVAPGVTSALQPEPVEEHASAPEAISAPVAQDESDLLGSLEDALDKDMSEQ